MHMRRIGAVAAAAAVAVTMTACGGSSGGSSASGGSSGGGSKPYIAIVSKGFQHQFWQAVRKGAQQEADKEGATISFDGPPSESDVEQQITMLQTALNKNPKALGFAALDSKAAAPLLQQAKSSNIPVIAFDSGVDSPIH
jgi:ribose transport system substrate-binding protein